MAIVGTLLLLRGHGCPHSGISQSLALQHRPGIPRRSARVDWYMMQRETRPSLHPTGQAETVGESTIPTCFRYSSSQKTRAIGVIVEMAIPI
jgi:hypothetical protein